MAVRPDTIFAAGCAALAMAVILHAAWSCEDAYITLRTIDNWVNGHGLRWNVAERVQSFTHPLWLFVLTPVYWATRDPTLGLIVPSLLTSLGFVLLWVRRARDRWLAGALLLVLLASKGFVEFSSPGLENPLVHLLLLVYCTVTAHTLQSGRRLWPVTLLGALLFITRADLLCLVLPSLLGALWAARAELLRSSTWLGLAPLAGWELFSVVYYGFPLPNTAYAKLSTGVLASESIAQGLQYLAACLRYDPVTVLATCAGLLAGVASRRKAPVSFALGLVSWHAYLVCVGADFMLGRLLTPSLVVAALVMLDTLPLRARLWAPGMAAVVLLASLTLPRSPLWGVPRHVDQGWLPEHVTDERALAYATTGLLRDDPAGAAGHVWVTEARAAVAAGQTVLPLASVGIVGYFLGPSVHIIDQFGLCDPLLARMPAEPAWSPGHFFRRMPAGYLETITSGQNQLADPTLAERYAELALITRGPLLDASRWRSIWRWNTRRRVPFPVDYEVQSVSAADAARAPDDGAAVDAAGALVTAARGLSVALPEPTAVHSVRVTLGSDDRYLVAFRLGRKVLWQAWVVPAGGSSTLLESATLKPPEALTIDSLLIRGRAGDYRYHVGAVRFDER
jgi:arabinofuranosyltransferase